MPKNNVQIVRECIEQIMNQRSFDRLYDFYSPECRFHSPPYVGVGVFPDDSDGQRLLFRHILPGSPAAGRLQEGDELLRAHDANGAWETFEQLRLGLWGQGKAGTPLTLTVRRAGKVLEVPIVRGRIQGSPLLIDKIIDGWRYSLENDYPDLKTEINLILGQDDLVAFFATNTGSNQVFHQPVVWSECNILRLQDGKITEWWGVSDNLAEMKQLGFHLVEPVKEAA